MTGQLYLAVISIGIGAVLAVLLFVPFVALSYRRRGGLTLGRGVLWAASLVYAVAIWTYTLLPLPDPASLRCAGTNLDLFAFVGDLRGAFGHGLRSAVTDPVVLQLVLNVLLFVPLGFFIRILASRGILIAALVGLAVSAVIEFTQLTGVWGLYPCAYRVFDVDDLVTNTTGAVLGSLIAFAVPSARHRAVAIDAAAPRPVTRGRRLVAMLCDGLAFLLVAYALGVATQLVLTVLGADGLVRAGAVAGWVGTGGAAAIWLAVVLATGATIGDQAVRLRYDGSSVPQAVLRPLRFLSGIGGYAVLTLIPVWGTLLAWAFAVLCIVLAFATVDGRGLPGLVTRQRLVDDRARDHLIS